MFLKNKEANENVGILWQNVNMIQGLNTIANETAMTNSDKLKALISMASSQVLKRYFFLRLKYF